MTGEQTFERQRGTSTGREPVGTGKRQETTGVRIGAAVTAALAGEAALASDIWRCPTVVGFAPEERTRQFSGDIANAVGDALTIDGRAWLRRHKLEPAGPLLLFFPETGLGATLRSAALRKASRYMWRGIVDAPVLPSALQSQAEPAPMLLWPRDREDIVAWLQGAGEALDTGIAMAPDDEAFIRLNLVGRSPEFRAALDVVRKCAGCDAPVLIDGATGTGKELAARAMHYLGRRRHRPFIPVNCGAIPDALFVSEMFGHERGAFTDAKEPHIGAARQADGGTLFLDEVDSLSPRGQVALLRFLQDREVRPLGGRRSHTVDVRIIAATNADLWTCVGDGGFRCDLVFRLAILTLTLPPLRRRTGDIPLLAGHFLRKLAGAYDAPMKVLSAATLAAMERHDWPGNVRELENFLHRMFVVTDGAEIDARPVVDRGIDDGPHGRLSGRYREAKAAAVHRWEHAYLTHLYAQAGGNVTRAAQLAGSDRRAIGKLLKKHGIGQG